MAAGEPPVGHRVFASRLKPDHARRFVIFGCVLFSAIGVSSFAATGMVPIMPVVFIAGTLFHFWPALNGAKPALQLDSTGITIDGLGTLVWEAVSGARIRHISRGPVKAQLLEIDTVLPAVSMMAEASRPTGLRRFQTRIGRLIGQRQLLVDLTHLEDPSKDILKALEYFLQRRVRGTVA
ncbi:MAG: hypothetical protein MUF14_06840 [Hyphomonadaceae bacterium]|nr:hypothetical protein [Hyphomonadaceae bacterium]